MDKQRGYTAVELLYLAYFAIGALGIFGWIANIYKLISHDFVLSGMTVARIVGIFVAPLGAILGYF